MPEGSRHWGDISADEFFVSRNLQPVTIWPAHPFTDPPPGTDGQPMEGNFMGSDWFLMYATSFKEAERIWVELHKSLAAAEDYIISAPSISYVSLWRAQPPPKLAAALARRTPWDRLSPRTLEGYRGRLNRQAGIRDPTLQAQWHRWAPDVKWLRRHGNYPPEYFWVSLWPQR
jgi:hypothetical protein